MNIKELKELIKYLPDELLVGDYRDGNMWYGVEEIDLKVEEIFEEEYKTFGRLQTTLTPDPKDRVRSKGRMLILRSFD